MSEFFDPAIHERVDDGNFEVGDMVALFCSEFHPYMRDERFFSQWRTVEEIDPMGVVNSMALKDWGVIDRVRRPESMFYMVRMIRNKQYTLDQHLDEGEDLL